MATTHSRSLVDMASMDMEENMDENMDVEPVIKSSASIPTEESKTNLKDSGMTNKSDSDNIEKPSVKEAVLGDDMNMNEEESPEDGEPKSMATAAMEALGGCIPLSASTSVISKKEKSSCEYYNEEEHLDDGDLPSLKVFRCPPTEANQSDVNDSMGMDRVSTRNEKKKKKSKRKKSSDEDDGYVVEEGRLSPTSKRKHRAFWSQMEDENYDEEERDNYYIQNQIPAIIDDNDSDDGPDDEMDFRRTNSGLMDSSRSLDTSRNIEVVENEEKEKDDIHGVAGGIYDIVTDLCSDCNTWIAGTPDNKEDIYPLNRSLTRVRSQDSMRSGKSATMSESERDRKVRFIIPPEEECDEDDGYSDDGLDDYDYKPDQRLNESYENTAIEVEYVEQEYSDEEEIQSNKKQKQDVQDISPRKIDTDEDLIDEETNESHFLQLNTQGQPTSQRNENVNEEDLRQKALSDNGIPSIPSDEQGGYMLQRSSSWTAPDKNAYLRAMAKHAKKEFKRNRGMKDAEEREELQDAASKGAALALSHSDSIDDHNDSHKEFLSDDDSLDKVLNEPAGASSIGPFQEPMQPTIHQTQKVSSHDNNVQQQEMKTSDVEDAPPTIPYRDPPALCEHVGIPPETNTTRKMDPSPKRVTDFVDQVIIDREGTHLLKSNSFDNAESKEDFRVSSQKEDSKSDSFAVTRGSKLASSILCNLRIKPGSKISLGEPMNKEQSRDEYKGLLGHVKKDSSTKSIRKKRDLGKGASWQQISDDEDEANDYPQTQDANRSTDTSSTPGVIHEGNDDQDDNDDNSIFRFESENKPKLSSSMKKLPTAIKVDPYVDSCDVSILGSVSPSMMIGDNASIISGRSLYTSGTFNTGFSTSTRRRHRGAAKKRNSKKAEITEPSKKNGWVESMKAAAALNNREWDPKVGWVDYKEPEKLKVIETIGSAHIGRLKPPLPSKSSNKLQQIQKESTYDDEDVKSNISFPSRWEKERDSMIIEYNDEDGTASAITEIISNQKEYVQTFPQKTSRSINEEGNMENGIQMIPVHEEEQDLAVRSNSHISYDDSDPEYNSDEVLSLPNSNASSYASTSPLETNSTKKVEEIETLENEEVIQFKEDNFFTVVSPDTSEYKESEKEGDENGFLFPPDDNAKSPSSLKKVQSIPKEEPSFASEPFVPFQMSEVTEDETMTTKVVSPDQDMKEKSTANITPQNRKLQFSDKSEERIEHFNCLPIVSPEQEAEQSKLDNEEVTGQREKGDTSNEEEEFVGDFNHEGSFDFSATSSTKENNASSIKEDSASSFEDGFKVIKDSKGIPGFSKAARRSPSSAVESSDKEPVSSNRSSTAMKGVSPVKDLIKDTLNQPPPPPPPPPPPRSKPVSENVSYSDDKSLRSQISSISRADSTRKAKEWVKMIQSKHKDISQVANSDSGAEDNISPIFVSANDDNSTAKVEEFHTSRSTYQKPSNESPKERKTFTRNDKWQSAPRFENIMNKEQMETSFTSKSYSYDSYTLDTLDYDNQTAKSELTSPPSRPSSDSSDNVPQNGTFLSRLQSCTGPVFDRFDKPEERQDDDMPMAHLAFLRKSQESSPVKSQESTSAPSDTPRSRIMNMLTSPTICGRPETIHEDDECADEGDSTPIKTKGPTSKSSIASSYLEAIKTKYGDIGDSRNDNRSVTSNSSEVKWQKFLENRKTTKISSRGSFVSDSQLAKEYASKKVDEIILKISKESPPTFEKKPTTRQNSFRGSPATRSRDVEYRPQGDVVRAAEDLAAAKVEAMMAMVSNEEGEI